MEIIKILSTILMLLTCACFSYQVVYLALSLVQPPRRFRESLPNRYCILIAARNEEAVLPHLLESIRSQDYPAELIDTYVIADNCTDRTAAVAAAGGACVHQRFNTRQVGKGYALHYLLEQIHTPAYDAFLIFDADNLLAPDYISRINTLCSAGYPAFCGYRNSKNFGSNWLSSGYGLWYLHDCTHLNRSRMNLGNTCYASGTGFGFTGQLLKEMGGWNFFTLAEDTEFRTWCATHGIPIGYCHDAVLYDEQPTSFAVSVRQRTRWIQGSLQVSRRYAGDFLRGLRRGGRTAWTSFEAATLSVYGYSLSAMGFLCRALTALLSGGLPALLQTLLFSLGAAYLSMFAIAALTLLSERRRIRATPAQMVRALFSFPIYMLSFLPIALIAVFRKFEWQPVAHKVAISINEL